MDLISLAAVLSGVVAIASLLYTWRNERSAKIRETATAYRM
jgi:hypothetical protein